MFDGQLQVQDEGVANLFYGDEKEPLVEAIKEELYGTCNSAERYNCHLITEAVII